MRSARAWLPAVVWAAVILAASNDPFSAAHTSHPLRVVVEFFTGRLSDAAFETVHFYVRKLAHLTEYAILALLVTRADRRWFVPLLVALLVATIDETHQAFVATRTGTPVDVAIDFVGAGIGVLLGSRKARHT